MAPVAVAREQQPGAFQVDHLRRQRVRQDVVDLAGEALAFREHACRGQLRRLASGDGELVDDRGEHHRPAEARRDTAGHAARQADEDRDADEPAGPDDRERLPGWAGGLLFVAYAVAAAGLALMTTTRRDVT